MKLLHYETGNFSFGVDIRIYSTSNERQKH